jgi:hypothetical protein
MRPASPGDAREARVDDLLRRVAALPEVIHELVRADRGVADAEPPDHLVVKAVAGQHMAGGVGGVRVPEVVLEEFAGVRQQLGEPVIRDWFHLRLLHPASPSSHAELIAT